MDIKDEDAFVAELKAISSRLMNLSNHHNKARGFLVDAALKADIELCEAINAYNSNGSNQ